MDLKFTEQDMTCPISKQIFFDPVFASDGHTYENFEICNRLWQIKYKYNYDNISPTTGLKLYDKVVMPNVSMKRIVDEYLKNNPDKKKNQYKPKASSELNESVSRVDLALLLIMIVSISIFGLAFVFSS